MQRGNPCTYPITGPSYFLGGGAPPLVLAPPLPVGPKSPMHGYCFPLLFYKLMQLWKESCKQISLIIMCLPYFIVCASMILKMSVWLIY